MPPPITKGDIMKELIKKYANLIENHTCKNFDLEITLEDFAKELEIKTAKAVGHDLLVMPKNCGHSKLKADVDKQEELVSMLYEFADKQIYKEGEKITHKGMREPDNKFRDIYSVGEYLTKIMKLFGYKITPID